MLRNVGVAVHGDPENNFIIFIIIGSMWTSTNVLVEEILIAKKKRNGVQMESISLLFCTINPNEGSAQGLQTPGADQETSWSSPQKCSA